ncbi:MAG: hypothetical protein D6675_12770 [Gemmatimonadetes bacterium]|nr:MAG: hypothetical protein D6675_12770 [Gemmatimonadota bacterium]
MITRYLAYMLLSLFLLTNFTACERDEADLEPAEFPKEPLVFTDTFVGVDYQAFGDSKLDALEIDDMNAFDGTASMKFTIPSEGDPTGSYAGAAFVAGIGRDLSQYDALTFWARASMSATLNNVGLGNDNAGTSRYIAEVRNLPLTTRWQKYIVPIPLAAKLTQERGLFYFADGNEAGVGYTLWIDNVRYETLGTIAHPRVVIDAPEITVEVGESLPAGVAGVTFNVDGIDQTVYASSTYFTLRSADENIATISPDGRVTGVALGTTEITIALGTTQFAETISIHVVAASPRPTTPAPTPTRDAGDVISLFSNAYSNVPVDRWNTYWQYSTAELEEIQIAGDDVLKYTNLNFVGIEFASQPLNVSDMTHFHLDIWTPNSTAPPAVFKVMLVDFGTDGVYGGGDDSSHEVSFTSPPLATEAWVSLDIPMSDFTGLTGRQHLAQLVLSGDLPTVYVDNVYFYAGDGGGGGGDTGPATAAPTPAFAAENVIALFSNAYPNVPIDTWSAEWDAADLEDIQIDGNETKKYRNLVFAGIEFTSQTLDVTAMTHFYLNLWTPDPTADPADLRIKLVDFGADGAYDGGDDVEHELILDATTSPGLATGTWLSLAIPLADFTGLTTREHLAQLILASDYLNTIYIDNVLFYTETGGGGATEPATPAPEPAESPENVIALFSNSYSNVPVDTWSAEWDAADLEDIQIEGNDTKKYTNLTFAGIEFTSQPIDAAAMTHYHMHLWTPDATDLPANFRIKLVDFGADGAYGGGDDVEHELILDATTSPHLATGTWLSLDIPLAEFTGLTTRQHLAQLILSSDDLNTIYVDNLYFYRAETAGSTVQVDFEAAGLGADWSWTTFENDDNPALEVVSNPAPVGLNPSASVAQFTARDAGQDWAGCETRSIGEFTFDETNSTITIQVYKSVISEVRIKFEGFNPPVEVGVTNTTTGQWEELTFDFSASIGNTYNKLVIFPDFAPRDQDHIIYFDNIQVPAGTIAPPPDEPADAAPTPTVPAENVISLFSNAYPNVTVDTWSAEWDAADLEDIQIEGNDTKKYTNLVFAGIEFTSQPIDATAMTHFHLHLWTPDATDLPANLRIKLVDFGADGAYGGGDDVEHELILDASTTPGLATETWLSLDIPLAEFTGLTTREHLAQLILASDYLNTIYVDNVFFHN